MSPKAPYRNSLRSKKMIKLSFLKLLATKDISKIKILEITEMADLSKGSFYTHYQDIFAVLEDIENENIDILNTLMELHPCHTIIENPSNFLLELYNQINCNIEIYSLLFKSDHAGHFLDKLQNEFTNHMMKDDVVINKTKDAQCAKIYFSFIAVGTAHMIYDWFTSENQQPFEEIVSLYNQFMTNGISAIFK